MKPKSGDCSHDRRSSPNDPLGRVPSGMYAPFPNDRSSPALPAIYFFMEDRVTSVCVSLPPHVELFECLNRASRGMMVLFSIDEPLLSRTPQCFGYKLPMQKHPSCHS